MAVTTTRRRKLQNKMRKKSLIKTYGTFLEGLTHLSNKCRKKMIQESPKEVIDCVGECCINLIKGNVRLTNAQKNQLRARKQHIRLLSSKQVPLDTKKKIINQKGLSLSVRKRIKDHFSSPALLSATKKRIKEEFSSPWVSYNEA